MKRWMLRCIAALFLMMLAQGCAAVKRDCNGRKKYLQPGGFYMEVSVSNDARLV